MSNTLLFGVDTAAWGFSLREKGLLKSKRSWSAFFYRTTFDDAFRFLAPFRICSQSNASRRTLIALSFWVWCRKGKLRLVLYRTCLPSLDLLIYPPDSRSEIIFLTDLSVIPINLDNSRPVIIWCLARKKSTIAWFVRNVHVAILMCPVILNRTFETPLLVHYIKKAAIPCWDSGPAIKLFNLQKYFNISGPCSSYLI